MQRTVAFIGLLTVVVITALIVSHRKPTPSRPGTNVSSYLSSGETAGFARVYGPRPFVFPQDHGPHRDYRTEWWYFTGNVVTRSSHHSATAAADPLTLAGRTPSSRLDVASATPAPSSGPLSASLPSRHSAIPGQHPCTPLDRRLDALATKSGGNCGLEGRHFGYQLTIFRIGLRPHSIKRASAWATNEIYMAHFAVTDVAGGHFYHFERFSRRALGLAGAQADPFRVWLGDWDVKSAGKNFLPIRITAKNGDVAIDLTLNSDKPVVPEGDHGFSPKSSEPGNASYYYSLTRMPTAGSIRLGSQTFDVNGLSWMDHEWSTSALAANEVGWDWFFVQLDDNRELMFYRLRRRDGSTDPASAGTLVDADGIGQRLNADDVRLIALSEWHSPVSGINYPSGWRVEIPEAGLVLTMEPYLKDQELDKPVVYWEGAVKVQGSVRGHRVSGSGYVELTGYGVRRK